MSVIYSLRSRSVRHGKKYIKINQKAIASICGFKSTATVSKAVDSLCRYGYLRIERFYDDYKKLGSYVYTVPVLRRDYFFINRRIFKFNLTSAQTRMYLFFCKCSESRSKRFWNSYNDICRSLKLKRSAVIKTISELLILGLIKKYRIRKKDGSFSDNHYRIISLKPPKYKFGQKKRRCSFAPRTFFNHLVKPFYKIIINQKSRNVNTFFYFFDLRGSPKICRSLIVPTLIPTERRKKIKLYIRYRCNLQLCYLGFSVRRTGLRKSCKKKAQKQRQNTNCRRNITNIDNKVVSAELRS